MTDLEKYELRPDLKALNDEVVALGKQAAELDAKIIEQNAALEAAELARTQAVEAAQKQFDAAKAKLHAVKLEHDTAVAQIERTASALRQEVVAVRANRETKRALHNRAIEEFNSVEEAKALAEKTAAEAPAE